MIVGIFILQSFKSLNIKHEYDIKTNALESEAIYI
jgi:hypothetical protein